MSEDFRSIAESIEANPLGRLMYGNRELFHSNLLAWFFDAVSEAADAVFRPFAPQGEDRDRWVDREHRNLDLVLHWTDRAPVVIENKVFSIPNRAQLDEYAADVAGWKQRPALVLLSVGAPSFDAGDWTYLSYDDLAGRIEDALPASTSYEIETMRRYARLARDLHSLISAVDVRSHDETVWLPESLLSAISSSQMRAAIQKARGARVARIINTAIPGLEQPAQSGMSRATPLVEAFEYAFARGMHLHLGWQLQGSQFRRAAVYHDPEIQGKSDSARARREEVSRRHPEFFAIPEGVGLAFQGRREFNHFAPAFVYRYAKAPQLTIAELLVLAREVHEDVRAMAEEPPERSPTAERNAP